ncbi:hypothetical protein [uncultured Megasphaera sp.]|uniref:hypothetical protein n=1 Tax=uncultured Megasphaera sp. TaxID=165188 RepID=UPI002600D1BD|nr:hypothetical protein [uncultured Megasphaera sp.]
MDTGLKVTSGLIHTNASGDPGINASISIPRIWAAKIREPIKTPMSCTSAKSSTHTSSNDDGGAVQTEFLQAPLFLPGATARRHEHGSHGADILR